MKRSLLLGLVLTSCGLQPAAHDRQIARTSSNPHTNERLYTGTLALGDHGPDFLPDDLRREMEANWREAGPPEFTGYLVNTYAEDSTAFDRALAAEIRKGRAAGIPEYGMNLRASLRGRVVALSEQASGFRHTFEVTQVVAITVCPKRPQSLNGCSN